MWQKRSFFTIILFVFSATLIADDGAKTKISLDALSLKKIMSDPDWMGRSPSNPRWTMDGQSVLFSQKALGHSHREQFQIKLADLSSSQLTQKQQLWNASQSANLNQAKTEGVFVYQGDVYWTHYASAKILQLTADEAVQFNANFASDTVISFMQGRKIFLYDLQKKLATQIADFQLTSDPEKKSKKSYLEKSQPRLLQYIEKTEAEKAFQKERRQANRLTNSHTFYLGNNVEIRTFRLSPNAQWLILGTIPKGLRGKADHMPEFVTADGYVNDRKVRPLVGTNKPMNETLFLVDLKNHKKYSLKTKNIPGINDDPLESLKKKNAKKAGKKLKKLEKPRAVAVHNWSDNRGVEWSNDSKKAAVLLYSADNKDRWIMSVDVKDKKFKTSHWLTDKAWVNDWTFYEFGWLPDNQTLYYLSEEDGYSHLYVKKGKRKAKQLTKGRFEVSNITVSFDGDHLYFKANKKHPGIYEIYRVASQGGKIQALTNMGGVNDYVLSPDEKKLLLRHSTTTQMPELYVTDLVRKKAPQQLTHTASQTFKAYDWQAPEIVKVPSTHIKADVYSRFYNTTSVKKAGKNNKKPAVIFVHGAGYLQNSHQGWSGYFREFMFHQMLAQQGYAVLDMDFRASKGYGRDWRTAIYRQMGTPELEDLKDGAKWLVENADVDPKRIGVYGGSYGGFMTFMALFKEPELFAAGASLRPVTDWIHYNHGYTSNILNTPEVDPEAYEKSSPIEFAAGLNKPLLIAHGMVDDNVFFKDTVRLVQKLIELEKTKYFETAIYPVEPHGFTEPSSWLDEYTRIHMLFEEHLNP